MSARTAGGISSTIQTTQRCLWLEPTTTEARSRSRYPFSVAADAGYPVLRAAQISGTSRLRESAAHHHVRDSSSNSRLHRTRTAALLCPKSQGLRARFAPVNRGSLGAKVTERICTSLRDLTAMGATVSGVASPDQPCEVCTHSWQEHLLCATSRPPTEGWIECPEENCTCHQTWSLPHETAEQVRQHYVPEE